jgi:thiol-disulfide isomerase/thioredoxin
MKKKNLFLLVFGIAVVLVLVYLLLQTPIGIQPPQQADLGAIDAQATIFVKDPATGNFNVWNGLAFGSTNPLSIPNGLSVLLPAGEYYVAVQAKGYDPIDSLITKVNDQSIVTADINLGHKATLWDKIMGSISPSDKLNNFALKVTPLPQEHLLRIGEYLPVITAYDYNGFKKTFLNEVYDRPVIVYVFSTWNTEAQEQMDIYKKVVEQYKDQYNFIAISTMEPGTINTTKIKRGDYGLDFYRPDEKFYDDYKIISLPQFFLATNRSELRGIIVGSRSAEDLINMIKQIYAL